MLAPDEANDELWKLPFGEPEIDPYRLEKAVAGSALSDSLDFRTRLLIHDSLVALRDYWGDRRFSEWLASRASSRQLEHILNDAELAPPGFRSIRKRLAKATKRAVALRYIRRLSRDVDQPTRLHVGGRAALVLMLRLSRRLKREDFADAHSHLLPDSWKDRVSPFRTLGNMKVMLLDPIDILVGLLFTPDDGGKDVFRNVARQFGRAALEARLISSAGNLIAEAKLREQAEHTWYIVFGDRLPLLSSENNSVTFTARSTSPIVSM
jgi:hypothetical protein